jgi:hypothetical protein
MAKTKVMTYQEKKETLRNFESMSPERKAELAKLNNMSVKKLHECLQKSCFKIEYLSINHLKDFRRSMNGMDAKTISEVEKINGMPFDEIRDLADKKIHEYEVEAKRKREFKKAWEKRRQEVEQELIKEGVIKMEESGCSTIDIFNYHKRMEEAQTELLKEFGYNRKGSCEY